MFKALTFLLIVFFSSSIFAKGDLAIRAKKLELKLGSDKSDYDMSQKFRVWDSKNMSLKRKSFLEMFG